MKNRSPIGMRLALALSSLIHAMPVILMIAVALLAGGKGNGGSPPPMGDLLPKPIDTVEVEVLKVKGKKKPKPTALHANDKCEHFYGGIGIMWNFDEKTIIHVAPGYPADTAGLKAGDVIITPAGTIRGPIGTEVVVDYVDMPSGIVRTITLVRDKICTSELRKARKHEP